MHVLLTCPSDLLCNLALDASSDEHADARGALSAALHELAEAVIVDGDRFAARLPDPIDAVIAMRTLVTMLPHFDIELVSFVASRYACEMLLEPAEPAYSAWLWLAARIDGPRADPRDGCCVVALEGPPRACAVPAAIAEQRLPATPGVVLWCVADGAVIVTDRVAADLQPGMIVDDCVVLARQ